jgi:hypothetical protein
MATIQARTFIAADPASVALLLGGPAAEKCFAAELEGTRVTAELSAPRRTGLGFATGLTVTSGERLVGRGSVLVSHATNGSELRISLFPLAGVDEVALRRWLQLALDDLGSMARARAYAA